MKKGIFLLALVLAAGAVVWAQTPEITVSDIDDAARFLIPWNFSAVLTDSVESRYSVQRFTSDVDNYIDPSFFDPQIGTFMFMGGYLNDAAAPTVSFGFGKTIGSAYLGVFYGGSLASGLGDKTTNSNDKIKTTSNGSWNNNLAVLFGFAGMGLRLDFIMGEGKGNDFFNRTTYDGALIKEDTGGETSVALGWGAMFDNLNLAPWARVGFKFPKIETETDSSKSGLDKAPTQRMTDSRDAQLGVQAGAWYGLSDTDSLVAELNFTTKFAREYKGDAVLIGSAPYKEGGGWGASLDAYYQKDIAFSKIPGLTLRIKPRLGADFISWSQSSTKKGADKLPTANWFTLDAGFDAGAEYKYEKIGLYTGFYLDLIEWKTISFSGGDDAHNKNGSAWRITGITWKHPIYGRETGYSTPILLFGLTFAPNKNLVIGAGFEQSVGELFKFNIRTMEISNITVDPNNLTNDIFGPSTSFEVTVSYKF